MMANHWLPVQGFDEDLADGALGEVGSNAGEIEKGPTDLPPAPNKSVTTTPQKRRAAAQSPSPRKKNSVAAKAVVSSSETAMAKNKGEEKLNTRDDPNVTTATTHPKGHAPATHEESGMTKEEDTTPTNIIKPDPEQSAAIRPTTSKNKKPKKANVKSSADTEENSTPPLKNKKTKVSSLPMPTSWAEAGAADRMLVSMRDNGDDWAKIRKQWKEVTGSDTAASTLPTRYSRLKASMTVLADGDAARLIHAKDQVELRLETEKYAMIADTLEQLGGKRYSNVFIRKEVKKLEKLGGAATARTAPAAPAAPAALAAPAAPAAPVAPVAPAVAGGARRVGVEEEEEEEEEEGIPAAAGTKGGKI